MARGAGPLKTPADPYTREEIPRPLDEDSRLPRRAPGTHPPHTAGRPVALGAPLVGRSSHPYAPPPRTLRHSLRGIALSAAVWAFLLVVLLLSLGSGGHASGDAIDALTDGADSVIKAFETPGEAMFFAVGVIVLLGLSAFFSGSETAFFSLHRLRLRAMAEEGSYTGRLVSSMMEQPNALLTTILAGNAAINVAIGVVLGTKIDILFLEVLQGRDLPAPLEVNALAYVLAVIVTTVALVFFGEVVPKVIAVTAPEPFARLASVPMRGADRLLRPLSVSCLFVTDFLFRVTRFGELRAAPFITDDELKRVLFDSEQQGVIHEQDMQMIQGILDFSEASLRRILTPRGDIVAIEADATVADAVALLRENRFSRLPVYEDDLDHIIGILVMKDLLPSFSRGDMSQPVRSLMRKAHFVPETMSVNDFIKDAQRRRFHLSIVVDEYGGTAGLVTLEDAMEEIVGEIFDESDLEELPYEVLPDGNYLVDGDMPLDEFSTLVGVAIEHTEHHTVAGYLMNLTERLLERDEMVETERLLFVVEETDERRIVRVRVSVLAAPAQVAEGEEASHGQ